MTPGILMWMTNCMIFIGRYTLKLSVILILITGCAQRNDNCLEQVVIETKETEIYNKVSSELRDSVISWANMDVRLAVNYKSDRFKWEISGILFDSERTRLIGWVNKLDRNDNARQDYVKFFVGERIAESWKFYFSSIPSLVVSRDKEYDFLVREKEQIGTAFSFQELDKIAIHELVKGGLVTTVNCSISDAYIDGWFGQPNNDLPSLHKKFLEDVASPE